MARLSSSILELARRGAAHRYQDLKAEIASLLKAFPHLRYGSAVSPAMPDAWPVASEEHELDSTDTHV